MHCKAVPNKQKLATTTAFGEKLTTTTKPRKFCLVKKGQGSASFSTQVNKSINVCKETKETQAQEFGVIRESRLVVQPRTIIVARRKEAGCSRQYYEEKVTIMHLNETDYLTHMFVTVFGGFSSIEHDSRF